MLFSRSMIEHIAYEEVVRPELEKGAALRPDFPGFLEDYLALHCLIREHQPERFFEIGTSAGNGTKVICNALSRRRWLRPDTRDRVFSLDVPPGTDPSIIYPDAEDGHPAKAGSDNPYPYRQLFGDSRTFDPTPYLPLDGWFIDGKHSYEYVRSDTLLALSADPRLIVWHDMQMDEVAQAVSDVMQDQQEFRVRRVSDTRVGFAVKGG
jgi:hypothetical protein